MPVEKYGLGDNTPGLIRIARIDFDGHSLIVIDSPIPRFDFTPSMSLFVDFDGAADLDRAFERLTSGGDMNMPWLTMASARDLDGSPISSVFLGSSIRRTGNNRNRVIRDR